MLSTAPATFSAFQPRVGDRVRIVLHDDRPCHDAPHFIGEENRVGRIVRSGPSPFATEHRYLVDFGRELTCALRSGRLISITARHYAADELEPIGSSSAA